MSSTAEASLHEFYSPFAHLAGEYEWARIHSTTHGSFDSFIVIHGSTDEPVTVYVAADNGLEYMALRYPESNAVDVRPDGHLELSSARRGRSISGRLASPLGPVRAASMDFVADESQAGRGVPYGGAGFAVWGSRYSCEGVDLELDAAVEGWIVTDSDRWELNGRRGIVTLGSYGLIRPRTIG